jgi:diguanylate cyclase (GGDEF)-like protein
VPVSARAGRHLRVGALSLVLASTGLALLFGPVQALPATAAPVRLPWPALALLFAATEILSVHVRFRRFSYVITLAELPLVLGLHLATPEAVVLARVVGSTAVHLRRPPWSGGVPFGASRFLVKACVATLVFSGLLDGREPVGTRGLLATFAAILATNLVGGIAATAAEWLAERTIRWQAVAQTAAAGLVAALTTTSLALVAVTVIVHDRQVAWLLLVMATVLFLAFRAYGSLRQQHESLELLHQFSHEVGGQDRIGPAMAAILAQSRRLLRAERAELALLSMNGQTRVRTVLGPDERLATRTVDDSNPILPLLDQVNAVDKPVLLSVDTSRGELRRTLEDCGIRDVMIAPLHDASGTAGTLLVANRVGTPTGFGNGDLRLLQTLSRQASVAIERCQLFDTLRWEAAEREYQALHDTLTGLPNRALFIERVRQAVGALGHEVRTAVLLIDLDRFKEVNDTLGHHTGDLVLREVGERLQRSLPEGHVIARLGGDEFAVLVPAVPDAQTAVWLGRQVAEAIERPLAVQELDLEVRGSIGIALSPEHGTDPNILLQRADVAMYGAKASHSGIELYAPERDHSSHRRLALVGELRTAIERRELAVHYQPKARLTDGQVIGVEALLRWRHPVHGYIPPEEFVSIAESTGLIRPLTKYVLTTALEQVAAWRDEGLELGMAVNLSVRNLVEPELVDNVVHILGQVRVPASTLTLEITEGQVMGEAARTIPVLQQFSAVGVHLSIDDFGTGYSSLTYLKRLPVDEVKIDKSFVTHMVADGADDAIVRSTVDLVRNLGLQLVAEGVEDRATWDRLAAIGCDVAQGYYLHRPMPPEEVPRWMHASRFVIEHRGVRSR